MHRSQFFLLAGTLLTISVRAQLHVGITADIGNYVEYSPGAGSLLKTPMAPSGSIMFFMKEQIDDRWSLQYGGSLGTLGYRIKVKEDFDTLLSVQSDEDFYSTYHNYNTIYSSVHLAFGRDFKLPNRLPNIGIFLGGGFSYYFESELQSGYSRFAMNNFNEIFEYEISRSSSSVKGFMELSVQTYILRRLLIGLRYRQHFQPALQGSYNFYHVNNPPSGSITLTQRAVSILFLFEL